MNILFKVASLALSYPSRQLKEGVPGLIAAVNEDQSASSEAKQMLGKVLEDLGSRDFYDSQERYVYLFDRTRSLSLHLFEHVHGESRDRGQAMVDLKQLYEKAGMEIDASELPDYLPLFLEFISVVPPEEAEEHLNQIKHLLIVLKQRLQKRDSIYANVFAALELIADGEAEVKIVNELMAQPEDDPDDLEALDHIWGEDPVTFGGNLGDNSCGLDRSRVQARADQRRPKESPGIRVTVQGNTGG